MIRQPGSVRLVARHRTAGRGPSPKGRQLTGQALRILIIEDNSGVRELLCRDLEARGCRVTATNNGAEGLEAIVLGRFDAVVSDAVMLPRGGLWLWREATTLRPELRGRFIFYSADGVLDAFDGPTATERFLLKPLDSDTLWAEILAVTTQPQP